MRERYYLVRLPVPEIDTARLAETEDNPVLDVRWWPLPDLLVTTEVIEPRGFAELTQRVVGGDVPRVPVVLG